MLKVARKLQLVGLLGLRSNQHFDALAEVSGGCGAAIGTASYTRGSVDPGRKPCKTFTSLNSAFPVCNPPPPTTISMRWGWMPCLVPLTPSLFQEDGHHQGCPLDPKTPSPPSRWPGWPCWRCTTRGRAWEPRESGPQCHCPTCPCPRTWPACTRTRWVENVSLSQDLLLLWQALNLHVEMRRREEEMRRKDEEHSLKMEEREKKEAEEREQEREKNIRREMELKRERLVGGGGGDDMDREEGVSPPPSKRPHPSEELRTESRGEVHGITGLTLPQGVNLPGTNIKITSRGQYLLSNKP